MKDWVWEYLEGQNKEFAVNLKKRLKHSEDLNSFLKTEFRGWAICFAEFINKPFFISHLRYKDKFNGHPDTDKSDNFFVMFASVLVDLEKAIIDRLSAMNNLFISYSSPRPGFMKGWKLNSEIHNQVVFIVFGNELGDKNFSWQAGRGIIIHELLHVIEPQKSDEQINHICKDWGFDKEIDAALNYLPNYARWVATWSEFMKSTPLCESTE